MDFKNLEYTNARKRLMQLYIVGEGLQLIGAVIALNSIIISKLIVGIGISIFILGTIIFAIAFFIRSSKSYRKLKKEDHEVESFRDITKEFGTLMTLLGLAFILAIVIGAIYFAYQWTHSWIKVVLFLLAFSFVDDLKEYFASSEVEDEL